jgi:hypothetical protein
MSAKRYGQGIPIVSDATLGEERMRTWMLTRPALPCLYLTLSNASIRSIAVSRCPPADADGDPQWGAEPTRLVYGAYDGSFGIVDLRDPDYPIELNRSRGGLLCFATHRTCSLIGVSLTSSSVPCMAVGWAPQMASPLFIDVDYVLMMRKISGILLGRNHSLVSHRGPVWVSGRPGATGSKTQHRRSVALAILPAR